MKKTEIAMGNCNKSGLERLGEESKKLFLIEGIGDF